MPLIALVCAGLLGWTDDRNPPTNDVTAAYRQIEATSGRTSDDQVRLALWCEAHGLTAERTRHLALALLADPDHAIARGLSGLVARDGRWAAPDTVARTVRNDPAQAGLQAEYDRERSATPYTADAQWLLGLWADEHGLKDQARAHFTAAARLDPGREVAWKRLGYRKHGSRWATDAQLARAQAEAEAQKAADQTWRPRLEKWQKMLAQPSHQAAARTALLGVTDPLAVRSIGLLFGNGNAVNQLLAVQLCGQIDAPEASLALAKLAVGGQSPEVRRIALEILALRDPRDCVSALVRLVRTPWKYEVRPVSGPGSVGELFVEGERYNIRRTIRPPATTANPLLPRLFGADVPLGSVGLTNGVLIPPEVLNQATSPGVLGAWDNGASDPNSFVYRATVAAAGRDQQIKRQLQTLIDDAQLAQRVLEQNVMAVEATNASIHVTNDRVLPVLAKLTGQNLGENHESWLRWNTEQAGYAFQSSTSPKPTYTEAILVAYQNQPTHAACFGAGTSVRTINGDRAIETIQRGDLVLVQDTTGGALSYQPVLTAFHNPPNSTYQVRLGAETIVATGIHRFWKAGKGWIMARDLQVGDSLRVLGGVARVNAVEPNQTEPVFNLEVAEGGSFFVGQVAALVHDNSLVKATPEPFDAVPRRLADAR